MKAHRLSRHDKRKVVLAILAGVAVPAIVGYCVYTFDWHPAVMFMAFLAGFAVPVFWLSPRRERGGRGQGKTSR